ncbi:MAG: MBL fold metallo-hydrolase [Candidatus Krumholzibacteria bacterium]|nr:MBL fold metallo-hydrolase [Candidatus Krumholzibacteria bacterium]
MKRQLVFPLMFGALLVCSGCGNRNLDGPGLVKISSRVYAMIAKGPTAPDGLGANSGFVVGRDGVLVIDARYTPALANDLVGAIRSVTNAPIKYLVLTHYHPDHAWGGMVFKEQGAVIMARPEARAALKQYSPAYLEYYKERSKDTYEMLKDIRIALSDSEIADGEEIDLGGVKVVLRCLGPAHTAGDCVVIVPGDKVAFVGGLLSNGYHPNLGDPGADFDNWIRTLDRLDGMSLEHIVPGQGKICGREALETEKNYIETIRSQCEQDIRQMVPLEKAASSIVVPGSESYLQPNILPFNVRAVYRREIMGVVQGGFALDLPPEFQIVDGGGSAELGFTLWASSSKNESMEIDVQWKSAPGVEVLAQDVVDMVKHYVEVGKYEMTVDGSNRIDVGGEKTFASYGSWKYKKSSGIGGEGIWTWALLSRGGKIYSIRLFADAGLDAAKEKADMIRLRKIASTFRITPRAS